MWKDDFDYINPQKKSTRKEIIISKVLLYSIEEIKTELLHGLNDGGGLYEMCHRKNRYTYERQMEVSYELNAIK